MQLDKKKQALLFGAICVLVIGFLIFVFISQFGGGSKAPAEESVTATIPDGEVQKMSDSKSEAFRGRVSTEDYFAELGMLSDEEEISLVSSEGRPAAQAGTAPTMTQEQSDEAAVARTFGTPPPSSAAPAPSRRSSGGGGSASRPMTEQERLDYDRRRAEMVRDVLVLLRHLLQSHSPSTCRPWVHRTALSPHWTMTSRTQPCNMRAPNGLSNACSSGTRR